MVLLNQYASRPYLQEVEFCNGKIAEHYGWQKMAFAMSLPRTKRVKYMEPDGTEIYQEDDKWALVRAVHAEEVEYTPGYLPCKMHPECWSHKCHSSKLQSCQTIDVSELRKHVNVPGLETSVKACISERQLHMMKVALENLLPPIC